MSALEQKEIHMSEEDLELLITLDDPVAFSEDDIFSHLQTRNNLEYWLSQHFPAWRRLNQAADGVSDDDANKVTFGQGDWTCTLSRLAGTTGDSMKGMNIEVCTVTQWRNGEIVDQRLFYDLVGMQNQTRIM